MTAPSLDVAGTRPWEQRAARGSRRRADVEVLTIAAATTAALDQLNHGVALIDEACRVRFANRRLRALCRKADGLRLHDHSLTATSAPDARRLNHALKRALTGGPGATLRLQRPSHKRPLSVIIMPLARETTGSATTAASALILINDPDHYALPPKERLMQAYGLTSAEVEVTRLMLQGRTVSEAAQDLGIQVETARTHLQHVLAKTGTHRQSELMRLLLQELGGIV